MKNFIHMVIRSFSYQIGKFLFYILIALLFFLVFTFTKADALELPELEHIKKIDNFVAMENKLCKNSTVCDTRVYYKTSDNKIMLYLLNDINKIFFNANLNGGSLRFNKNIYGIHYYYTYDIETGTIVSKSTNSSSNTLDVTIAGSTILYSSKDIMVDNTTVYFAANYPYTEPEPTPPPETEDKGGTNYEKAILLVLCSIFSFSVFNNLVFK